MLGVAFLQRGRQADRRFQSGTQEIMTTTGRAAGERNSPWRKLRLHTWLGRIAWAVGLVVVVVLTAWLMARSTPRWYQPLDPNDDGVSAEASHAQNLMAELNNSVQRVPLGDQRWTITQNELNSLLAVYAHTALDQVGNPISDPYVRFENGKVTIAARSTRLPSGYAQGGVGSVSFSVGIVAGSDGAPKGLARLESVHVGVLTVPKSLVESRLRAVLPAIVTAAVDAGRQLGTGSRSNPGHNFDAMIEQVVRAIVMGEPFPLQYRIDRRDVIIKELKVEDGRFTIVVGPPVPALPPTARGN
jgi:hypothetical protein